MYISIPKKAKGAHKKLDKNHFLFDGEGDNGDIGVGCRLLNYFVQRWRPSSPSSKKTFAPAIDGVKVLGRKGRRRPPCINPTVVSIVGGLIDIFFVVELASSASFDNPSLGSKICTASASFCLLAPRFFSSAS